MAAIPSKQQSPFSVGDIVRLAQPRWDQRTARVHLIFSDGTLIYLSNSLEGKQIWPVDALVLVERAHPLPSE